MMRFKIFGVWNYFKVIDGNGETMNSLSIEDSKFLRYKLEEITRDMVDKNMM